MTMKSRERILLGLREHVTAERAERIRTVADNRTGMIRVAIEDIYQDRNAGAVFRTCDCFGIQRAAVIENAYEAQVESNISKGSDKWLTIDRFNEAERNNSVACIDHLKSAGYRIVAATPRAPDIELPDHEVREKTAIILGTEEEGLSEEILDRADLRLRIPIFGFTQSFNVSVSAALILQELVQKLRQSDIEWRLPEPERTELEIEWLTLSLGRWGPTIREELEKSATP